jgi:YbgC/YbaW family acyl-CoA thioester hydrolase
MPARFRTSRRVEFGDTDMAGIMHFARFFNFMEEAEHEFLRSRGLSVVMRHAGRKIGWPRVAARCDFLKPVRFEDVVEIEVTLSRIGGKSLTYSCEFFKDGTPVARGQITTCCVQMDAPGGMAAIELPPDIRQALEAETGGTAGEDAARSPAGPPIGP